MYRAIVILLLAVPLLGCSPSSTDVQAVKLDEVVVTQFLGEYEKAFNSGETGLLQSFYSEKARLRVTNASGVSMDSDRELLRGAARLIETYGLNHKEKILERVIVVTGPENAVVEQRARETWLFKKRFNDFAVEVVSRITISLENQTPRILNSSRRIVSFTGLSSQRQENLEDIFLPRQ